MHDSRIARRSQIAVEYLKVALEDTEEPGVLLIALRRIAEARGGIAKVAKAPALSARACIVPCRRKGILGSPRWLPLPRPWG